MFKKTALYIMSLLLTFLSALILITCVGYYILFFDWDISLVGKVINAVLIIISITASIAIYAVAEKLKRTN
ncbi:hypothetical protein LH22_10080 [Pantoea rwandensis]|uniref:Uncharacterized protein n=1 Tax=Pantoea rwandensis TaxID=1076550 RepID=A0ABM5RIF5_9GAMM|nr:hypothetical protein [Pantoea sp. S61]AIR85794.1 hypothetical protein LH22_10080 [Pantoea rwandensis]MBK0124849.1 hypothetical protein [Pantoea sp. S61]